LISDGSAAVVLDTSGSVYIWWPFGRVVETKPEVRNTTFDDAKQANRAIAIPLASPVVKIVLSHKNIYALQHELKVCLFIRLFWALLTSLAALYFSLEH